MKLRISTAEISHKANLSCLLDGRSLSWDVSWRVEDLVSSPSD